MKKKIILMSILLFFTFIFNMDYVFADMCNIGVDGKNKGYGNVELKTYSLTNESVGTAAYGKTTDWNGSYKKFKLILQSKQKKNKAISKITDYKIEFYDHNKKLLCDLTNKNFIGLEDKNVNQLAFNFYLNQGSISYFMVSFDYNFGGKIKTQKAKQVDVSFYGKGTVQNVTTTTTKNNYKIASKNGWYMCNNRSNVESATKVCQYYKKADYIDYCEVKVYSSENECKKNLGNTKVTSTKATKKTKTTTSTQATANNVKEGDQSNLIQKYTTGGNKKLVNDSKKIQCDGGSGTSLKDLIDRYWKIIAIFSPVILLLFTSLDFMKAILASDADQLKKSSSNALKRTLAFVILIMLPWALSLVLGWFGLELCF